MAATGLLAKHSSFTGLRPVDVRHDLGAIADLIAVCFAPTLDAAGRSAIQEMRTLSRMGPLLGVLAHLGRGVPLARGYVWVERDRIVGNVSVVPAGYDGGWVIANVAVAPEYRRRGIARRMMQAALAFVDQRHAFAILQVEADNAAARTLYEQLGFNAQRVFTRWRRAAYHRLPAPCAAFDLLEPLTAARVAALTALATQLRPNERGGLGWRRPLRVEAFRPARRAGWRYVLSGQRSDYWVIPADAGQIKAAVRVEQRIGGTTRVLDLLVHPAYAETVAPVLLNITLRRFVGRRHSVVTDHPADDTLMGAVLRENLFRPERSLLHMIRPAPVGVASDGPPTDRPQERQI